MMRTTAQGAAVSTFEQIGVAAVVVVRGSGNAAAAPRHFGKVCAERPSVLDPMVG
jgi:hypothetical protein